MVFMAKQFPRDENKGDWKPILKACERKTLCGIGYVRISAWWEKNYRAVDPLG